MKIIKFILWLFVLVTNLNAEEASIKSQNGNFLIFQESEKNEHFEANLYKKLIFSSKEYNSTIYINNATYYFGPSSSILSGSGRYVILDALEGSYIAGYSDDKDEKPLWKDKVHCLVIDMQNGCISINETDEACMLEWEGDELYYTIDRQKEKIELKRSIKDDLDHLFDCENINFIDTNECKKQNKGKVDNAIRCNAINPKNIEEYEKYLSKDSGFKHKEILKQTLISFVSNFNKNTIRDKTYLYLSPDENSLTKAYLIKGDEVIILEEIKDKTWQKIAYINRRGKILVRWVKILE